MFSIHIDGGHRIGFAVRRTRTVENNVRGRKYAWNGCFGTKFGYAPANVNIHPVGSCGVPLAGTQIGHGGQVNYRIRPVLSENISHGRKLGQVQEPVACSRYRFRVGPTKTKHLPGTGRFSANISPDKAGRTGNKELLCWFTRLPVGPLARWPVCRFTCLPVHPFTCLFIRVFVPPKRAFTPLPFPLRKINHPGVSNRSRFYNLICLIKFVTLWNPCAQGRPKARSI